MDKTLVTESSLHGWRRSFADAVAPWLPVKDETARALIGAAFFVGSVVYVAQTLSRALERSKS